MSLALAFTHLIEGYDIPAPSSMLKMRGSRAESRVDGLPYSLLTNLHHAVVWQEVWLRKLRGQKTPSGLDVYALNWRVPSESEWQDLRKSFLDGLVEARGFAGTATEAAQVDALCRILVHASYHVGQMYLLKRAGAAKP